MAGLLFVTAHEANHKNINEALLSMRDWDDSNGGPDVFKLVTDKSGIQTDEEGTPITLDRLPENAWAGASLEVIEAYCLDLKRDNNDEQKSAGLFVVIDPEGLENKNCVLASMPDEFHENPSARRERYDKIRVPWDDVYMIWCNLDIANMDSEEFVGEEEGDEQGWFRYQSIFEGDDEHREGLERKDMKVEDWRRLGHV
jgi:hypothetical protein